jgi:hypothetical protein
MSPGPAPVRCVVLDTGAGDVGRSALQAAAEFARLLRLELLGIFIEDPSLLALCALPFARELRMPECDWQALQPRRLEDELRAAGLQARQLFRHEVESRGVAGRFEVRRGDPAALTGEFAQPTDILVVVEPQAADALAPAREVIRRAALSSPASLLVLPRSGMAGPGLVAAVADSESDTCFELASRVAAASGETAIAVPLAARSTPALLSASLTRALGAQRERLLIMPRNLVTFETLLSVASERRVPVLLVAS